MKYRVSTNGLDPWTLFIAWGFLLPLFLVASTATAQEVAPQISYQGRILNAAGTPLAGPVDIEIGIYQSDTDPSPGYRELHSAVPLEDGIYSILIGQGTVLDGTLNADLFTGGTAMLEVTVNGETLTPRQPFASSAYAFRSVAETTGDLDIQGGFRVQPAGRYFIRGAEGVAAGSPLCECDLDGNIQECGDAFFSNQTSGNTCYDLYDDFTGGVHHLRAVEYNVTTAPASLSIDSTTGTVESGTAFRLISGEPTLVLHDTNGGGIRPRIRFENNGTAAFEGDDAGDQYFNFYSTFQSDRTNSAHIRAYGAADGSWDKYTEISHDGTNGTVATDTGDLILESRAVGGKIQLNPGALGRVKIGPGFGLELPDGTLQTTAYRGFPGPSYDSGWVEYSGSEITLNHDLGGNADNYFIDLTFKNVNGPHIAGLGSDWRINQIVHMPTLQPEWWLEQNGVHWKNLTTSTVQISSSSTTAVDYVRVRIWVYE